MCVHVLRLEVKTAAVIVVVVVAAAKVVVVLSVVIPMVNVVIHNTSKQRNAYWHKLMKKF